MIAVSGLESGSTGICLSTSPTACIPHCLLLLPIHPRGARVGAAAGWTVLLRLQLRIKQSCVRHAPKAARASGFKSSVFCINILESGPDTNLARERYLLDQLEIIDMLRKLPRSPASRALSTLSALPILFFRLVSYRSTPVTVFPDPPYPLRDIPTASQVSHPHWRSSHDHHVRSTAAGGLSSAPQSQAHSHPELAS